jgi:hypothetical protein
MILDSRGKPVEPARMGFVPSAPAAPRPPKVVKEAPRADAVGFTIYLETD